MKRFDENAKCDGCRGPVNAGERFCDICQDIEDGCYCEEDPLQGWIRAQRYKPRGGDRARPPDAAY